MFHDEDKGITCYETPLGDIVCEGIDDGPHFSSKELPQAKRYVSVPPSRFSQYIGCTDCADYSGGRECLNRFRFDILLGASFFGPDEAPLFR